MATEQKLLEEILAELKRIGGDVQIIQGDLNAIRNGEYDPPGGAGKGMPGH